MLVTEGGRFGGWGLYMLKGKPVFVYNLLGLWRGRWEAPKALDPGKHSIDSTSSTTAPDSLRADGVMKVDGTEVASEKIEHCSFAFAARTKRSMSVPTQAPALKTTTISRHFASPAS